MESLGFRRAESDWGVFYRHIGIEILILASHIDDCMVTRSNKKLVKDFKANVARRYKLTDLGPISSLLGMKVTRDHVLRTISLSQDAYIDGIITTYNFTNSKPLSIPMDLNIQLSTNQSPKSLAECAMMKNIPYREAVGSLMHLAIATCPDIAFTITMVAQFGNDPGPVHWDAVKRIFCYLIGMKKLVLTYGGAKHGLEGFTDADGALQEH